MLEGQVEVLAHQLRRPPPGDLSQINKAPTPNTHRALVLVMAFLISAPKVLKHCLPMPRVPAELSIYAQVPEFLPAVWSPPHVSPMSPAGGSVFRGLSEPWLESPTMCSPL